MILVFYGKRGNTSLFPTSVLKTLERLAGSDNCKEGGGGWREALHNDDDNDDHAAGRYTTGNVT